MKKKTSCFRYTIVMFYRKGKWTEKDVVRKWRNKKRKLKILWSLLILRLNVLLYYSSNTQKEIIEIRKEYYGTKNSNILSVHRSIYRHIFLWREIDLDKGVLERYYRT